MHFIQKYILDQLRITQSQRYAQLKPDEIESGHFRYHLQQLVKDGDVEQLERGLYGLTIKGQSHVDALSEHRVNPMKMPKVITYTLLRDGNKILLQKKPKQPYMNLLNMIGGKLQQGEVSQDAAVREVYEKTGNTIKLPKLVGVLEIIISNQKHLLTHAVAYIYTANVKAADYTTESIHTLHATDLNKTSKLAPDFLQIFNKIQNATSIFVDNLKIEL